MRKTMLGLLAIGVALLSTVAMAEHRELLSSHETVAVFDGIKKSICMGLTASCPWKCGSSGDYAKFTIKKYLNYKKPGKYGDPEWETYSYQITAYKGRFNKQPVGDPKFREIINGLKQGDYVLLSWNHDYVDGRSPERPIVKLEKISKERAGELKAD